MRRFLIFALSLFMGFSLWAYEPDEITLKSGEKLRAIVVDSMETLDTVTVNLSLARGIVDYKEISKTEIASVTRATGASEEAFKIELGRRSNEVSWYQNLIDREFKPWLKRYTRSPLLPQVQDKMSLFKGEMEKVRLGNVRVVDKWYTLKEFEAERPNFEAADLLIQIQAAIGALDFTVLSIHLRKALDQYIKTKSYPEIVKVSGQALAKLDESQLSNNLASALKSHQEASDNALINVKQIINQPVPFYKKKEGIKINYYNEGWFKAGGSKPDFNTADITKSQELLYKDYCASNLVPGIVYFGDDLEFNSLTRYFIADLTHPAKRLSQTEMQEVNRLYRILGAEEKYLPQIQDQLNNVPAFLGELKSLQEKLEKALPAG